MMRQTYNDPNALVDGAAPRPRGARPSAGPTMVMQAYDHLLTALMTLQIAPGERIAIDQVARRLNISQTPIREALSQLEAEKMVCKVPNIGYRASPQMTRDEVRDLYTLRQLIEPYAAARAAEAITEEAIDVLRTIDRDMSSVVDGDSSAYPRFAEADDRLHRLIATLSGNRLIAETVERLHAHLNIFRVLYRTNAPTEAAAEHRIIIDALVAGDSGAAERAVLEHLERSQQRMDSVLAENEEAEPA
ncbi:GntR family transcriptional regulator [Sphingomonas sp. S1-29]|uniref:GntR family transcriptional regulator n=1 Tax=Sphingomonas sp. S1-29 TaxID=2991074 RepID=UPI00223FA7C2|nr:GntR family transcriptional regulator [Sphingomonas sp. S1-29]UZK69666.1 GntR family transcriptional regulator [Sphingomonas sp. S1-29]